MSIIIVRNAEKKYRDFTALAGANLDIEPGECLGLLGPNGAGKTTLIRLITGTSPATEGEITIAGMDIRTCERQIKALIGVVPQLDNLDPDLTVIGNLLTFSRYFDMPRQTAQQRSREVLELVGLENRQKSSLSELSGGMKRRLMIARGLINRPRILILDEPTVGLDPQAKHLVWHKLRELKNSGVTLVLCTQVMEEASELADRVAIMDKGSIICLAPPAELVEYYVGRTVWEVEPEDGTQLAAIQALTQRSLEYDESHKCLTVYHVNDPIVFAGMEIATGRLKQRQATLEDVFLKLTGRALIE